MFEQKAKRVSRVDRAPRGGGGMGGDPEAEADLTQLPGQVGEGRGQGDELGE